MAMADRSSGAPITPQEFEAAFEEWWQRKGFMTDPKVAEKDLCRLAWNAAMAEAKKHINLPAIPDELVLPSLLEDET